FALVVVGVRFYNHASLGLPKGAQPIGDAVVAAAAAVAVAAFTQGHSDAWRVLGYVLALFALGFRRSRGEMTTGQQVTSLLSWWAAFPFAVVASSGALLWTATFALMASAALLFDGDKTHALVVGVVAAVTLIIAAEVSRSSDIAFVGFLAAACCAARVVAGHVGADDSAVAV